MWDQTMTSKIKPIQSESPEQSNTYALKSRYCDLNAK